MEVADAVARHCRPSNCPHCRPRAVAAVAHRPRVARRRPRPAEVNYFVGIAIFFLHDSRLRWCRRRLWRRPRSRPWRYCRELRRSRRQRMRRCGAPTPAPTTGLPSGTSARRLRGTERRRLRGTPWWRLRTEEAIGEQTSLNGGDGKWSRENDENDDVVKMEQQTAWSQSQPGPHPS